MSIKRLLHTGVKVFLMNPYVVRCDHPNSFDMCEFRHILKRTRALVFNTWGYCNPAHEGSINYDYTSGATSGSTVYRSYWVFSDDMDALQFRLTVGESARQVAMWPSSRKFTITEIIEVVE